MFFSLSKEKYSMIKKSCDIHGIKISEYIVSNIINQKVRKSRQSLLLHGKKTSNKYLKKIYTASNLPKVKMLIAKENLPTQNYKVFKYICSNNNENNKSRVTT